MTLKVRLESVFTYNFNFAVCLGYRNITFFPYRPSLRFQAHVASTRPMTYTTREPTTTHTTHTTRNTRE